MIRWSRRVWEVVESCGRVSLQLRSEFQLMECVCQCGMGSSAISVTTATHGMSPSNPPPSRCGRRAVFTRFADEPTPRYRNQRDLARRSERCCPVTTSSAGVRVQKSAGTSAQPERHHVRAMLEYLLLLLSLVGS